MGITKDGKVVSHIYKPKLITRDGEEVERVLYIESTDRSHFYINTGYVPNQNSKIIYDFEITNWGGASSGGLTNQYGALFGKRTGNHTTDSWVICRNAGNNSMRCEIGNANYGMTPTFSLNTRHKVVSEYNKITFDETEISIGGSAKTYSNLELFLFAINHNGAPDGAYNSMLQKLYGVEIYEGTEIKKHFIPVKYDTEYCMLDLVENKLYHNQGTGAFSGGDRVEVKKISQLLVDNGIKYYLLDYLENSAQSHINLGIACNEIKKVEFEFQGTAWSSDQIMFGAFTQEIKGCNYPQIQPARLNIYGNGVSKLLLSRAPSLSKKCKITIPISSTGTAYYYEDGMQVGSVNIPTANRETDNMILFTLNLNGSASASHYSKIKVYSFKGWGLDDKPLFDLVPVEKEDGTKGMLDLVNHTFYENSGTGTFSGNKKEIILFE